MTDNEIDPVKPLLDACNELQYLDCHGCTSGDCPHDSVHDCVKSLTLAMKGAAGTAATALKLFEQLMNEDADQTHYERDWEDWQGTD